MAFPHCLPTHTVLLTNTTLALCLMIIPMTFCTCSTSHRWVRPLSLILAISLAGYCPALEPEEIPPLPTLQREYRGVWVATVANIDWPSKPGLSTEEQQKQAISILDNVASLRMNVVVLQIRTSCDSLYASNLEPWSYFLTGEQGKPPQPYYDPLEFWIAEAHQRGLELHAWFNPFRAKNTGQKYVDCGQHISRTRPDLVKRYGNDATNYLWLDPGEPESREHSLAVFLDVLKRYDIDGIHIDDYFYPYPVDELPFPDEPAWQNYQSTGGSLQRDDWRRQNMNQFIEQLYSQIKKEKPYVKFGISPFGIWKPGYPSDVSGFSQHDKLYADAKLWWNEGWCDYYTPQLYWSITAPQQSFPSLLRWWAGENIKGRHLVPGIFTSRIGNAAKPYSLEQLESQVFVARHMPGSLGCIHFSMKPFIENREGLADRLKQNAYQQPAVAPACSWIDDVAPAAPRVSVEESSGSRLVSWAEGCDQPIRRWCVYYLRENGWDLMILGRSQRSATISVSNDSTVRAVAVVGLDAAGNASPATIVRQ